MPVIHFDVRELERLLGKKVPREDLVRDIPMLGADVDDVSGDQWAIEFFPNRPDHYTVEGIARTLRAWYGVEPGLREYAVAAPQVDFFVGASVAAVRPHVVGAMVRGVDVTDARLDALIELQEDLHHGLGARRRKVAIGVHDAAALKPPFYYTTVGPDDVRFQPLAGEREMTPREILDEHPKGVEYAHLLEAHERYPIIVDSALQVASLPPVINGTLTEVTTESTDLFLDVTGTDAWAVNRALNILATSLAEGGATVEAMRRYRFIGDAGGAERPLADRIRGLSDRSQDAGVWETLGDTPDFTPDSARVTVAEVRRVLGVDFTPQEIAERLRRLAYGATPMEDAVDVAIPCYRVDVQHEWDLIEDVAIGHGINNFEYAPQKAVTVGRAIPGALVAERARTSLTGLGFLEVMTLALTNPDDQFGKMGLERGWSVDMRNALSEEYSILRTSLVPNLLSLLKKNAHRDLPQRLFEIGIVLVEGPDGLPRPMRRVAGVTAASKANFSGVKGTVLGLARDMGWAHAQDVGKAEHPAFLAGRAARLPDVDGVFGEVHPRTLQAFGLGYPVTAFEFTLGAAGDQLAGAPAEWRAA